MTREEYFERVEQLLNQKQAPGKTVSVSNRTDSRGRWLRGAGGGRFPGRGLIRYYSDTLIYLMFENPSFQAACGSPEEALQKLELALISTTR